MKINILCSRLRRCRRQNFWNKIETTKFYLLYDIRIGTLEQVYEAQSGHPGGALSCSDILAVLYFNQMNIDPKATRSSRKR